MPRKKAKRKAKKIPHHIELVEWRDHYSTTGNQWTCKEEIAERPCSLPCITAGFLVLETDEKLVIGLNMQEDREVYADFMTIIKSCVISRKRLN